MKASKLPWAKENFKVLWQKDTILIHEALFHMASHVCSGSHFSKPLFLLHAASICLESPKKREKGKAA